ncbi:hypothetical protein NP233_g11983 [Leucocoprinus birnbaumii]|uniref:mRNA guanylyltransferase n=1 Tax=Leucocoprinus birnbaumii TaxID=56174 RepID=A0AAD5VL63_9AGAR|nr:hypothetical protein NP233_g11983 [Leucocoprinus birnbaumii]
MVHLVTSDNERFEADKEVVERSVLIKNMLEDVGESDQPIPLPNVSSSVLKKVLEYCEHHRGEPLPTPDSESNQDETRKRTTDISEWDQKFITVDQEMLFEIILAANYLDIKSLLDVGCKTVANMIKGKTPEEIRKLFNIVNDFTPEEEAQIKKENVMSARAVRLRKCDGCWQVIYSSFSMPTIPDLPGDLVPRNSEHERWLKTHVGRLCHTDPDRFPGSQPVSFASVLAFLLRSSLSFWVCEKSDGVRVLLLVLTDPNTGEQTCFIIDRHNSYRQLTGLYFPHHENPRNPLMDTLVDGELVIDVDPRTQQETVRYLAFDCLVADNQNVMSKPLDKRCGRLNAWFFKPFEKMIIDHPHMATQLPFQIKVKETRFSYHVRTVFDEIPSLQHGNDGLIYTCVSTPYSPGTDNNILKWKPPSENSIDFKLVLRFPPIAHDPKKPDFHSKPLFLLHAWTGGDGPQNYEQYDEMYVEDDEWERLKQSGEQIDDRIVEVHWETEHSRWRMMRFRDDKPHGNHISVAEKIIQSIADGVEKDTLLERSDAIRNAWKARLGQPASAPPHQQPHHQHSQMPPPAALPNSRTMPPPQPPPPGPPQQHTTPRLELRYGPLAVPMWSKVAGPSIIAGMQR